MTRPRPRPLLYLALAAALGVLGGSAAFGEVPEAEQYAYGFPVLADGGSDLYQLEVPLELYRSVVDLELRDCGVYNAEGEPVPRVFEAPAPAGRRTAPLTTVPWFGVDRQETDAPDLLRLRFDYREATLQLDTVGATTGDPATEGAAGEPPPKAPPVAYIVDTRAVDEKIVAVHLDWPDGRHNFVGRIGIERSDDLETWRPAGAGAIADLQREDGRIRRRTVAVSPAKARYLRLRWSDLPADWTLAAVEVEPGARSEPVERRWLELPVLSADVTYQGWVFDLGGSPWIDRIDLLLPSENTVVRARFEVWNEARDRWEDAHQGFFYRLHQGGNTLESEPDEIAPRRIRRLRVTATKGRLGSDWSLRLGWRPDHLTFVAQGSAPYRVAAGRAADARDGFPQARLLADRAILELVDGERYGRASLGERFEVAGPASLAPPAPKRWPVGILWAVLVLGVALVGAMAWRLMREEPAGD